MNSELSEREDNRMRKQDKHRSRLAGVVILLSVVLIGLCVYRSLGEKGELEALPDANGSLAAIGEMADNASLDFDGIKSFFLSLFGGASNKAVPVSGSGGVTVHFLDVGQGKAILIQSGGENAVIDVGENGQGSGAISYLRERGVEKIDLLIGTHPHSDHIGDMDMLIEAFEIGEILLPDIPAAVTPTTQTYTDLLLAIGKKGLQITLAQPGEAYSLGDATLTILSPLAAYTELNELSVATRLVYGETAFLFTGDIEAAAEADILESGRSLKADVLDVAHHGSNSSSTADFLERVRPSIAVISCGVDNSYGHPARDAVERLQTAGATIYRTDLDGAVVVTSDGNTVEVETAK
jgi:beta-lactamase superfamily II metal-dependent hydrolase